PPAPPRAFLVPLIREPSLAPLPLGRVELPVRSRLPMGQPLLIANENPRHRCLIDLEFGGHPPLPLSLEPPPVIDQVIPLARLPGLALARRGRHSLCEGAHARRMLCARALFGRARRGHRRTTLCPISL